METLLLPILLFAVFYLILIRPQQKQRREIAQVQSTLAPGARVMTGSGLIATIVSIDGDEVTLEVAPGVTNRYLRRSIMRVVPDDTTEPIGADMAESQSDKDPMIEPMSDDGASRGTDRTNRNDITGTSP